MCHWLRLLLQSQDALGQLRFAVYETVEIPFATRSEARARVWRCIIGKVGGVAL